MAAAGPEVERSMKILTAVPLRTPLADVTVFSTLFGVGRLASTMRAAEATAAGDSARVAPAAISGSVAALFVSKMVNAWPAESRRCAMPLPIRPTPMNPMSSFVDAVFIGASGSRLEIDRRDAGESRPRTRIASDHEWIMPRNEMLGGTREPQRRAMRFEVGRQIVEDRKRTALLEIAIEVRGVGTEHDPAACRRDPHDLH